MKEHKSRANATGTCLAWYNGALQRLNFPFQRPAIHRLDNILTRIFVNWSHVVEAVVLLWDPKNGLYCPSLQSIIYNRLLKYRYRTLHQCGLEIVGLKTDCGDPKQQCCRHCSSWSKPKEKRTLTPRFDLFERQLNQPLSPEKLQGRSKLERKTEVLL